MIIVRDSENANIVITASGRGAFKVGGCLKKLNNSLTVRAINKAFRDADSARAYLKELEHTAASLGFDAVRVFDMTERVL